MADSDSLPQDGTTFSQHGETISAHSATNAALISGVACGTAVILCLLCALCWMGRHKIVGWYCRVRTRMGMKPLSDKGTPSSTASEWSVHRNASTSAAKDRGRGGKEDLGRSDSTSWTRHDLRRTSVATAGTAPHDVSNLGIGLRGLQEGERVKYTCLNPDPLSATTAGEQARAGSVPPWMQHPAGNSSAPALPLATAVPQNPFLDRSLPASPSVSSMPMPITPPTGSDTITTPTTASTTTRSPTSPVWSTPYQTHPHLPSQPQHGGSHRLQTPDHEEKEVYTPSLYQPYPPTSLTRAHPTYTPTTTNNNSTTHHPLALQPTHQPYSPAHLPQNPSTVSLGSTAEIYRRLKSCTDLYRGLASHVSTGERPPWDFLSAEDARGGGWRNSDASPAETGWETVGDGDGEGETMRRGAGRWRGGREAGAAGKGCALAQR